MVKIRTLPPFFLHPPKDPRKGYSGSYANAINIMFKPLQRASRMKAGGGFAYEADSSTLWLHAQSI